MSVALTVPTLCDIAAHKIAIHLSTKCSDLSALIHLTKFSDFLIEDNWQHYREQHENKILVLPIPRHLIQLIQRAMKPVTYEILDNYLDLADIWEWTDPSMNLHRICWTGRNKINVKETIKSFLFDETFKITDRYEVACNYKIEEAIPVLWDQLSDLDHQRYFLFDYCSSDQDALKGYNYVAHVRQCPHYVLSRIVNYLTEGYPGRSLAESLAIISFLTGSNVAFIYYWEKLSQVEKDGIIVRFCKIILERYEIFRSVIKFNFLLYQLNDSQQRKLIEMFPFKMAVSFFFCTAISKFSEVNLQYLWTTLTPEEYSRLLRGLDINFSVDFCNDEDFHERFMQVWSFIPDEVKNSIKSNPWSCMTCLPKEKGIDYVRLLLSQAEEWNVKQLAFSGDFQEWFSFSFATGCVEFLYEILTKWLKLGFKQIQIITRKILILDKNSLDHRTFHPDRHDSLDRFLNYVFLSKKKVTWLKSQLMYRHGRTFCRHLLHHETLDDIDQLLKWGLGSQEEIANFRKSLLNDNEFFYPALSSNRFEIVDKFLRQCLESDEEIEQLKMKLLLDRVGLRVFGFYLQPQQLIVREGETMWKSQLRDLLQWFNPPSVYFAEFRDKMKSFLSKDLDSKFERFLTECNFSF